MALSVLGPRARQLKIIAISAGILMGCSAGIHYLRKPDSDLRLTSIEPASVISKAEIARLLEEPAKKAHFPTELKTQVLGNETPVVLQYSFNAQLQDQMEKLMRMYRPDYGAIVALDPVSGRILSLVSFVQNDPDFREENLALRATFPSASVFKVVTAAAAIAEKQFSPNTMVSFNGRNHTLYRSHVLREQHTRWTRHIPFKDAFALSVNTVFGRLGAMVLGPDQLRRYADRFGFNRAIAADLPVQAGRAEITEDAWELAETASGYTRSNTMSPLQGAMIAASVVNEGKMMEPYVVRSVHAMDGAQLYSAQPTVASVAVDPETAAQIRELMRATVTRGTSKRSFRGFFRGQMRELDVGGKTGSLTGTDPYGKYDWFVGYGDDGENKIAIAALTVHKKLWRVKSSYLARRAIEVYFRQDLGEETFAHVAHSDGTAEF